MKHKITILLTVLFSIISTYAAIGQTQLGVSSCYQNLLSTVGGTNTFRVIENQSFEAYMINLPLGLQEGNIHLTPPGSPVTYIIPPYTPMPYLTDLGPHLLEGFDSQGNLLASMILEVVTPEIIVNPILPTDAFCLRFGDQVDFSLNLDGVSCVSWDLGDGSGEIIGSDLQISFWDGGFCSFGINGDKCKTFTITATINGNGCPVDPNCPPVSVSSDVEVCCEKRCTYYDQGPPPGGSGMHFSIVPNPPTGTTMIRFVDLPADGFISMIDVMDVHSGTQVYSVSDIAYSGSEYQHPFDVSFLPTGSYVINAIVEGQSHSEIFVIP